MPRAEARRRGGVFDLLWGWVGSMFWLLPFSGFLATEGSEFTERFFLLPTRREAPTSAGVLQPGKELRLCGGNFLTRCCLQRTMAKQDRYRNRYREVAGWDVGRQENPGKYSAVKIERCSEGRAAYRTGIDFDFNTDRTDRTDRQPHVLVHVNVHATSSCT